MWSKTTVSSNFSYGLGKHKEPSPLRDCSGATRLGLSCLLLARPKQAALRLCAAGESRYGTMQGECCRSLPSLRSSFKGVSHSK